MKKLYLASVIGSVLLISACSGGGGGNDNPAPQAVTPSTTSSSQNNVATTPTTDTPATQEPSATTPSVSTQPINDTSKIDLPVTTINRNDFKPGAFKNVDAGIGKISGFNQQYSINGAWAEISDPTILETAGKRLILAKLSGVIPFSGKTAEALWNALKNPEREVFYGGIETDISKIPTSGKITYLGYATRYDNVTNSVANIGKSQLVADFDNKKISGELSINGLRRNISLKETDIVDNSFTGDATAGENSVLTTRYGNYEGKFYGPNAEEVAGKAVFPKEKNSGDNVRDLDTSFSATQEK